MPSKTPRAQRRYQTTKRVNDTIKRTIDISFVYFALSRCVQLSFTCLFHHSFSGVVADLKKNDFMKSPECRGTRTHIYRCPFFHFKKEAKKRGKKRGKNEGFSKPSSSSLLSFIVNSSSSLKVPYYVRK